MFEWDPRKAEANAAKHDVSFDDAVTVFLDANALDGPDCNTRRPKGDFGGSADQRTALLMVVYTLRRRDDAEIIRLISARRASRREAQRTARKIDFSDIPIRPLSN